MSEFNYGIAGRSGSIAGYGNQNVENTEIERRLIELEKHNEDLRSIVGGLLVKLQPVLVPQMKGEGTASNAPPRPVLSPMADRLDKIIDEGNRTASILRDVFDRIAL